MLVNKFLFNQQLESNVNYQIHVPECFSWSMVNHSREKRLFWKMFLITISWVLWSNTQQYKVTLTKTKAIKSTKTWSLKNTRFPKFHLDFVLCFVHSSQGGCTGKPRALPVRPPRENHGRCAYDSRHYCINTKCHFFVHCMPGTLTLMLFKLKACCIGT